MKALVAVDGSEGSWEALRQAAALLSPERDEMGLFYAPPALRFRRESSPTGEVIERSRQALADAVFTKAGDYLPRPFQSRLHRAVGGHQHPREELMLAAEQWRADLIAVGARGTGLVASVLLGSVSRWVVHHATIPVLVARTRPKNASAGYRVLIASREPRVGAAVCRLANELSWPVGTRGRLLHVAQPPLVGELPPWLEEMARRSTTESLTRAWIDEREAETRQAQETMNAERQKLPRDFQQEPATIEQGYPGDQILRALTKEEIDLVVVGARHSTTFERVLLGSTSEQVLNHATCSVLVVPQPLAL